MNKVLFVDDDLEFHHLFKVLIKRHFDDQIEMIFAKSGQEAILQIKNHNFELIVSDVEMQNGDGIFLYNYVRNFNQNLNFIFFTAKEDFNHKKLLNPNFSIVYKSEVELLVSEMKNILS